MSRSETRSESDERSDAEVRHWIIVQYPLGHEEVERINREFGIKFKPLVITGLSGKGYLGIIRALRSYKAEIVCLGGAAQSDEAFLPVYNLVARIIGARSVYVFDENNNKKLISNSASFFSTLGLLSGGLIGGFATLVIAFAAIVLRRRRRIEFSFGTGKKIGYILAANWHGLIAGGAPSHVRGVVLAFSRIMEKTYWLTTCSNKRWSSIYQKNNIHPIEVGETKLFSFPRESMSFRLNGRIRKSFAQTSDHLDFIYHRYSLGVIAAVQLSRRYGIPLILEYNGSELWISRHWGQRLLFSGVAQVVEDVCIYHAHLIVVVSEPLRQELIARKVEPWRIVVIPNGVELDDFKLVRGDSSASRVELRQSLMLCDDATVITFVGTFGIWHGTKVLAKAAIKLAESYPDWFAERRVHFVFVGDGALRSEVSQIMSKRMPAGSFTFTGVVAPETVPDYLAVSDVLVVPNTRNEDGSEFFGSPTKLFEYMAAGRPVIASNLGQLSEVMVGAMISESLEEGDRSARIDEIGILVEPGSVDDLERALAFAVKSPMWREIAGRNARERVEAKYTWNNGVEKLLAAAKRLNSASGPNATKVLVNALHSRSGGGLNYLKNILPLLEKNESLDIHLVVHEEQLTFIESIGKQRNVHTLRFKGGFWRRIFYEQIQVPLLEREIDADVVFSPANYIPFFARKNVLLLRNALGVAMIERRPKKLLYWGALTIGTSLSVVLAKSIVSVSKYAKNSAAGGLLSMVTKPVDIVPHGVNALFKPGPFEMRSDWNLLAVSDLYVQKNLHTLLVGLSHLVKKYPEITLSIAGAPIDHDYELRLRDITLTLNLEAHVSFLGSVSTTELAVLYRKCALFVFPSTVETFGNPLVEAMASGAPIATSNVAAMPEVAGDGACFFNPFVVEDMVEVISGLMDNKAARQELSERAIERAKTYSWERNAEQLGEIFERFKSR